MKEYVWKRFEGSDDWALVKRGETPKDDESNCLVVLSRMNRYFPWSIYVRGNRDKNLEANVPSDNIKDIKEYILSVVDTIDKHVGINEAPEDGIFSDDELDELERKERDEFEAKLKARREKNAQDKIFRDEKIAKEKEMQRKAGEVLDKIGEHPSFEDLFDALVPDSGKCETLAGELVRAANRIEYRWFNDGDRFFEDYGIETCGPAFKFIVTNVDDDSFYKLFESAATKNFDDDRYDTFTQDLKDKIVEYILSHKETLAQETKDMLDIRWQEVEDELSYEGWIPTYEYDADLPDELRAHLEKGNISERDLEWEVESWCENMGCYDARVDVNDYVYIEDLNKQAYDELNGNLYKWLEQYANDLTNEYGDPYEEEEEEEPEEEGEE